MNMKIRRTSRITAITLFALGIVGTGFALHRHAAVIEAAHATTPVTSYSQIAKRIEVDHLSDLPRPVQDAKTQFALTPAYTPKSNASVGLKPIIQNLIAMHNQLRLSKFSQIYAVYLFSPNSPKGNIPGMGNQDAVWLIVATYVSVPRSSLGFSGHSPTLLEQWQHDATWYFGITPYPDAWQTWVYSATTGRLIENTMGTTPQRSRAAYEETI